METALRLSGYTKELKAIKTKNNRVKIEEKGCEIKILKLDFAYVLLCILPLKSDPVLAGIMGNIPYIIVSQTIGLQHLS